MDDRTQPVAAENAQAPVIEPGYTFATVTDKISSIVLTRPTSNGWFFGFGVAFLLTMMCCTPSAICLSVVSASGA